MVAIPHLRQTAWCWPASARASLIPAIGVALAASSTKNPTVKTPSVRAETDSMANPSPVTRILVPVSARFDGPVEKSWGPMVNWPFSQTRSYTPKIGLYIRNAAVCFRLWTTRMKATSVPSLGD